MEEDLVAVNSRQNNLTEFITKNISRSIKRSELQELEHNPGDWSHKYLEVLVRIYMSLIHESRIRVLFIRKHLIEPIVLYETKVNLASCGAKQRRRNRASYTDPVPDDAATDRLLHVFSTDYIVNYFLKESPFKCEPEKRELAKIHLPKMFVLKDSQVEEQNYRLSDTLSQKLVKLYVLADHAASHFNEYRLTKNIEYNHGRQRPAAPIGYGLGVGVPSSGGGISSSSLSGREYALASLFTQQPDTRVQQLLNVGVDLDGFEGTQTSKYETPINGRSGRGGVGRRSGGGGGSYKLYSNDVIDVDEEDGEDNDGDQVRDIVDCISDRFKTKYFYHNTQKQQQAVDRRKQHKSPGQLENVSDDLIVSTPKLDCVVRASTTSTTKRRRRPPPPQYFNGDADDLDDDDDDDDETDSDSSDQDDGCS